MGHPRNRDGRSVRGWVAGVLQGVASSALWYVISGALPWLAAALAWWAADSTGTLAAVLEVFRAHPVSSFAVVALVFLAGVFTGVFVCMSAARAVARDEADSGAEERSIRSFLGSPAEVRRVASRAYREGSVLVPEDQ